MITTIMIAIPHAAAFVSAFGVPDRQRDGEADRGDRHERGGSLANVRATSEVRPERCSARIP